ncbi:MAG: cadmium-translocating P-type ATPase [Lachnospiraceae bacterium]|nr:cadmium-translocating P-type ATPase [Lachnospiraceae bacterium]
MNHDHNSEHRDHKHQHHQDCSCGHEHHHEHQDCGCDHEHHHEHPDCGCNHEHHHKHQDCDCGHEHHYEHQNCDCGHEHHHEHQDCDCGHEHHHEHQDCDCGHEHHHEHQDCDCGHEHHHTASPPVCSSCGKSLEACTCGLSGGNQKKIYLLENLGCANCAAKMEDKISHLEGITSATITFATKQLRITARNPESYLPKIQEICASIESEVKVVESEGQKAASKKEQGSHKKDLALLIIGASLFIIGELLEQFSVVPSLVPSGIFIIAYLLLGAEILLTAGKNILKGQIFDENFLMSIATLGALAIQNFGEAVGVMLFYRIGEFFEEVAVEKSRSQIMDAVDLRPETVNLISGEQVKTLDAALAKPGDLLLVRPGDRIPLDGIVLEGESRVDTSPITGEPVPVQVKVQDSVISGCVNTSGQLKIRVEKPLSESMVTRILDSVENAAASKPKIDRFITRFARIYTPIVVLLALGTAILPSLFTGNWNYWIYTALTFLVMSCPCALVLSVPLAFFSGIGAGSKKGILFKGGAAIEAMKQIQAVVMDKTGTITQGNFVLQKAVPAAYGEVNSPSLSADQLLALCASCEQNSTHPIAVSIVTAARQKHISLETPLSLEEIPGHGLKATLSQGEVLCGNQKLMEANQVPLLHYQQEDFGSQVLIALNGTFVGHMVISDTLKPDAKSAIQRLKHLNIRTAMLTGDAADNARTVAAEIGIDEVHAKLLPEDKLDRLTQIRSNHGAVMFVGDGINDAPVLAGADVGAAMGSGADAAIEAADVVFMTSAMEAIPQSLSIARAANRISVQNVIFALAVKAAVMALGLFGFASMWMAVFADTGVAMLCILNSIRILYKK